MQAAEQSLLLATLDELTQLELTVAQRADELKRLDRENRAGRDFWQEAEAEVWMARVSALGLSRNDDSRPSPQPSAIRSGSPAATRGDHPLEDRLRR